MHRLVGVATILFCIFGGFMIIGGNIKLLWKPMEMVIIFGSGIGGLLLGCNISHLKALGSQLKGVFKRSRHTKAFYQELILLNFELIRLRSAPSGSKQVEKHIENPATSDIFKKYPLILAESILMVFIVDNYRVTTLGQVSAHELDDSMDAEIEAITEELNHPNAMLNKLGDAFPGFGVLGAVMGIILTMQSIDSDISMIGMNIATALVGTFLGIFGCYCVCFPLSTALKGDVERSILPLYMVKQMLVTAIAGKPPLLCIDAGRRMIEMEEKPTFSLIESWTLKIDDRRKNDKDARA
ncbi:flagellar motor stator protein MotA [Psychromonas sp. Urea-02u-13]|uniref:flagellar motor stator protein MotA n=1 Tax=Psychromonas sp. Urea-02u-13 TaxID=2058326 RepID=UPI0012FF3CDC|nr:flagellar motor stator protein MotA [Psychromonas sp. Urea-02u-13]